MSYQVLARKWRPANFHELVGQEHVKKALISALDADRLHHAYLFTGTRGVGKTTIARILSKCLNCLEGISSNPCGQCAACKAIAEGRFVDLIEVDAASRTRIDDTRELLENVQYRPTEGRYKVYLIDEVHMLSTHSFNALLKTLEEPPPHVIFLLATTDPQKLPVTVLSRCLQFHLRHMSENEISQHLDFVLQQEKVKFETAGLELIAQAAQGSMRDAMSLLDQGIAHGGGEVSELSIKQMLGTIDRAPVWDLITALAAHDDEQVFRIAEKFSQFSADFEPVLAEIIHAFHELAIAQRISQYQSSLPEPALRLCEQISATDLQLFYQIALHGRRDLPLAPSSRMGFEMTLLRMLAFQQQDSQKKNKKLSHQPVAEEEKITIPSPAATPEINTLESSEVKKTPASSETVETTLDKQSPEVDKTNKQADSVVPDQSMSTAKESVDEVDEITNSGPEPEQSLSEPEVGSYNQQDDVEPSDIAEKKPLKPVDNASEIVTIDEQNWPEIAENLKLEGMSRQLIINCHFIAFNKNGSQPTLRLCCTTIPQQAINEQRLQQISQALQQLTGAPLQLKIDSEASAEIKSESAREIQIKNESKRQMDAEYSLKNDVMVQDILKRFDAKIRPDSVQPT